MAEEKKPNMTKDEKIQKQYDRLIAARNYHYDNLNKWLMSFYVIIGALFVAFYTLYSKGAKTDIEITVAVVGYVVSLSAWLSGKGYGYWENKWMEKIHNFEKNVLKYKKDMQVYTNEDDEDKHDCRYNPTKGANVSTTKVAIFMTGIVTIAWGFLIMMLCLPITCLTKKVLVAIATSIIASYILMVIGETLLPSIEKHK